MAAARISTVVKSGIGAAATAGKTTLSSQERMAHKKPIITLADITNNGELHPDNLLRILNQLQDNVSDATAPTRTDPLAIKCILHNVSLTSGTPVNLKHTLGTQWRYAWVIGMSPAPGSGNCFLIRVSPAPVGYDQTQYCSVIPTGSGVFDICICPA